eukprot:1192315-Prorocentrum_minimum.AAC.3
MGTVTGSRGGGGAAAAALRPYSLFAPPGDGGGPGDVAHHSRQHHNRGRRHATPTGEGAPLACPVCIMGVAPSQRAWCGPRCTVRIGCELQWRRLHGIHGAAEPVP